MKKVFAVLRIVLLLGTASFLVFSFYLIELFKDVFIKKADADVPSSGSTSSGSTSSGSTSSSNSGSSGSSGDST